MSNETNVTRYYRTAEDIAASAEETAAKRYHRLRQIRLNAANQVPARNQTIADAVYSDPLWPRRYQLLGAVTLNIGMMPAHELPPAQYCIALADIYDTDLLLAVYAFEPDATPLDYRYAVIKRYQANYGGSGYKVLAGVGAAVELPTAVKAIDNETAAAAEAAAAQRKRNAQARNQTRGAAAEVASRIKRSNQIAIRYFTNERHNYRIAEKLGAAAAGARDVYRVWQVWIDGLPDQPLYADRLAVSADDPNWYQIRVWNDRQRRYELLEVAADRLVAKSITPSQYAPARIWYWIDIERRSGIYEGTLKVPPPDIEHFTARIAHEDWRDLPRIPGDISYSDLVEDAGRQWAPRLYRDSLGYYTA